MRGARASKPADGRAKAPANIYTGMIDPCQQFPGHHHPRGDACGRTPTSKDLAGSAGKAVEVQDSSSMSCCVESKLQCMLGLSRFSCAAASELAIASSFPTSRTDAHARCVRGLENLSHLQGFHRWQTPQIYDELAHTLLVGISFDFPRYTNGASGASEAHP